MAPIVYESGLEPAPQDFPEVTRDNHHHLPQYPQYPQYPSKPYPPPPTAAHEPFSAAPSASSTYDSHTFHSPPSSYAIPLTSTKSASQPRRLSLAGRTTICGCGLLVFILSCIIALLSAAVIALAATTGVQVQRANNAAAALNATATATAPAASATATAAIDGGCGANPGTVNKSVYTSFALLNSAQKFTRFCNRDAPSPPLLSLFTADFSTCIDACAGYTHYVPSSFPLPPSNSTNTNSTTNAIDSNGWSRNTTCTAVSFIPAWTNKGMATAGGAPGNCYLKGGPQNETGLTVPDIGVACHVAIALPLESE
ncbi:hypothetical protein C8A05DRAFT_30466 [Staphylotrichum tortipilum]|uniref:Uncharacterized protein n=1 Tax=Staphylotrichum tortipilum TaxID=2831512 RepID=A0AAN6RW76_9PEZI|nr:hypothetical protein C8A05DRAFT_30466 [Staphylotrichum longicolle]